MASRKRKSAKLSSPVEAETSGIGKILSITVENFMTFSAAVMQPGPFLNVLIGPNGTGKSSMVAAIVIGMGGSTKVLSAKLRLQEYIKNGQDNAKIGIRLFKNEQNEVVCFERSFTANGKSTFKIDDRKVPEDVYLEEIRNVYNIQVENMCQFLPQDRVQDFAKQNPQELLNSTQISVCPRDVIEHFAKLKELRQEQLNGKGSVQSYHNALKENEARIEVLRVHVQNIKQKNKLVAQMDLCGKKKTWIEYENMYNDCQKLVADLKIAKDNHQKYAHEFDEINTQAKQILRTKKMYEDAFKSETNKQRELNQKCNTIKENVEKQEDTLKQAEGDLAHMKKQAVDQEKDLRNLKIILQSYERDLADHNNGVNREELEGKTEEIDKMITETKEAIRTLSESRSKLMEHLESDIKPSYILTENRLARLESAKDAKLEMLKPKLGDLYKAVHWLRNNQQQFQYKIYEPMLLELNLKQIEYAKYVENCIAFRDLTAFTCEDVDDMTLLIQKLRTELKLNCNVVHSDAATEVEFKPRIPIDSLKKFGGERYLIDCLDAPIPILNYLCKVNKIHDVLIGNQQLDLNSDKLPISIQLLFTPTKRISIITSKYTKERSSMSVQIQTKQLLGTRVDQEELQTLRARKEQLLQKTNKLKNTRNDIEAKIQSMEEKCKECAREKADIKKLLHKSVEIQSKIDRQKERIHENERLNINADDEERKFKLKSIKCVDTMIGLQQQYAATLTETIERRCLCEKARVQSLVFNRSCADIDIKISECRENAERAKRYVDNIDGLLDSAKKKCKAKEREAMVLTNNSKPSEGARFKFKAQFEKLPDSIDELLQQMDEIEGQIECMGGENQGSLKEYEDRMAKVQELRDKINNSANIAEQLEVKMSKIHDLWYPQIMKTIDVINKNFETFMLSMNCAGEVELIKDDERDYESYGIEIRVKYRANERLQALDRFVQSGGERAVAIAVYSLSLQQLTQVPFRCVDEINQGMDPDNERKIFDMLVRHVAKQGQSQFFYVTPKLLPSMVSNKFVSCVIVHNGSSTDNNTFFHNA